jgi:hypothetical protein
MTTREKAINLVNKYLQIYDGRVPQAKRCALIAIDEIVEHINELDDSEWYSAMKQHIHDVKKEIEKL